VNSTVLEFEMKMWIHVPQHKSTMYTCQPLTAAIFVYVILYKIKMFCHLHRITYTYFANCIYLHKPYIKPGFLYNCKKICIHNVTVVLIQIFYMHCIFLGVKTWMTHTRPYSESGFHILVN
jgi:hypothetical protein